MSISRISAIWFKEFSHPLQWQHCCIISYRNRTSVQNWL